MPIYQNAGQLNDIFVRMFNQINQEEPHALDKVAKSHMVIKFQVTEPAIDLWVDGRSKPVEASSGDLDVKPTLTVICNGESLHELLLGTLPISKGISSKRLKVNGSLFKAIRLEDLLHHCQSRYPSYVEEL